MSSVLSRSETSALGAEVEVSALFEQHRQRVYRFCVGRLGNREDAADAVQDTYAKAWLALRDGCVVRQPLPWLLTIAGNVCASRYRARRARPQETPLSEEPMATVTYLHRSELADLPAALRALPEEQRRAFVLRELRGCSYEEIGDTLGASHASVAALLHRARRSVAATLAGTGRKALVVVPFPSLLRSAFEGGGATVAATAGAAAAATAAGTLLLVAPQLPLHHHRPAPSAPATVERGASNGDRQPPVYAPTFVTSGSGPPVYAPVRFDGTRSGFRAIGKPSATVRSDVGPRAPAPVLGVPATVSSAPETSGTTAPEAGAQDQPRSGSSISPGAVSSDTTPTPPAPVAPVAGTPPSTGTPAEVNDSTSRGIGPPADPGSQGQGNGQGNGNANGPGNGNGRANPQGNAPPADPGALGNGPPADPGAQGQGPGQGSSQAQGNGQPADPGSQGNGQGVGNAGGKGQGGTPADPGSQGSQGNGSPGAGKDKDPNKP